MNRPAGEPRHCQLMDPATDPQEFIESSIYWYPLLFPTRTEVLEHTLLVGGNGYEWGADGNLRSEFAHIEPDYDWHYDHLERAAKYENEARDADPNLRRYLLEWAARDRAEDARLRAISRNYRRLARTYGIVRMTEQDLSHPSGKKTRQITSRELKWTLLGEALSGEHPLGWAVPSRIAPAWQAVIEEARLLFADLFTEQGELF